MKYDDFKTRLRNLEPGKELVYHAGHLGPDRAKDEDLNRVASLALAVDEIGAGVVFQRRIKTTASKHYQYGVRVFRKLGIRKDGNGDFQEALRVAELQVGRINDVVA